MGLKNKEECSPILSTAFLNMESAEDEYEMNAYPTLATSTVPSSYRGMHIQNRRVKCKNNSIFRDCIPRLSVQTSQDRTL